jgi:uncharacterized damage-inducible protein DinB
LTSSAAVEKQTLLDALASQRQHVLGILEDLDDEAMRRPVLPSGWSCLALLRHLALDDERFWFSGTVAGDPAVVADVLAGAEDGWHIGSDDTAASVVALYREQVERSDAVLAAAALDDPPAWWPEDLFGSFRLDTVREVLVHVLTETAVHAGHLDAARELIDGRQWMVLD